MNRRWTPQRVLSGLVALSLVSIAVAALPLARARAAETKVDMAGLQFLPPTVAIQAGDTVTWQNSEAANYPVVLGAHSVVSDDNAFKASPLISPGESWSLELTKPGTYAYRCGVHPAQMKGAITVQGEGGESEATPAPEAKRQEVDSKAPGGGTVRRIELTVEEKQISILGVPMKSWTFNGTVPGTTIRAHVGDTLEVVLHNTHNVVHSFHTHFSDYDQSSDGSSMTMSTFPHQNDDPMGNLGGEVPGIAGSPGPHMGMNPMGEYDPRTDTDVARPGETYTYRYRVNRVGTFFYHCHAFEPKDHIQKGLFGMIIAYPKGWSWKPLPPDPLNGNTKAWVTTPKGEKLFEDVFIRSERNPVADQLTAMVAQGGVAGGPIYLANFRAFDRPYVLGPVKPGQPMLVHVGNIGDNMLTFHVHGHHFYRLWQSWDPEDGSPAWTKGKRDPVPFTPLAEEMHTRSVLPGETMPVLMEPGKPGWWFAHDHVVPHAELGMIPWLRVLDGAGAAPNAADASAGPRRVEAKIVEREADDPNSWAYDPSDLTISAGDTVVWRNAGKHEHTVTAEEGAPDSFDSGRMKPNATWERTFDKPGQYAYYCTIHPWMKGIVRVGEASRKASADSRGGASGAAAPKPATRRKGRAVAPSGSGPASLSATIVERSADPKTWVYEPAEIALRPGDAVVWKNDGKAVHTVSAEGGAAGVESGDIAPSKSWKHTFGTEGTFAYTCKYHPWMKGVVRVAKVPHAVVAASEPAAPAAGDTDQGSQDLSIGDAPRSLARKSASRAAPTILVLVAGLGIAAAAAGALSARILIRARLD